MADLNLQVKLKGVDEGLQKTLLGLEASLKNISEITKGIDFSSIAKVMKAQTSSINSSVEQASSGISKLESKLAKLEAKTITLNPKNGAKIFEGAVGKFKSPTSIIGDLYAKDAVRGINILLQAEKNLTKEEQKESEKRIAQSKRETEEKNKQAFARKSATAGDSRLTPASRNLAKEQADAIISRATKRSPEIQRLNDFYSKQEKLDKKSADIAIREDQRKTKSQEKESEKRLRIVDREAKAREKDIEKRAKLEEKARRDSERGGILGGFKQGLTSGALGRGFVSGAGFAAGLATIRAGIGVVKDIGDQFVEAEEKARSFDKSLREIKSLGTIVDEAELKRVGDLIGDIATKYGTDLKQQTEAFYTTVSNGIRDTAKATEVIDAANKLATAGVGDVNKATILLTDALNVINGKYKEYGLETITASKAADILFNGVNFGKIRIDELTSSLGKILPIGNKLGISLEDMTAALAGLTTQGLTTRERTIQLQGVFNQLIKQQDKLPKGLELTQIKVLGLAEYMARLEKATKGNVGELADIFTNIRALQGVLGLTGTGLEKFIDIQKQMAKSTNAASVAAEELQRSLQFDVDAIVASYDRLQAESGKSFSNFFTSIKKEYYATLAAIQGFGDQFKKSLDKSLTSDELVSKIEELTNIRKGLIRGDGLDVTDKGLSDLDKRIKELKSQLEVKKIQTQGNPDVLARTAAFEGLPAAGDVRNALILKARESSDKEAIDNLKRQIDLEIVAARVLESKRLFSRDILRQDKEDLEIKKEIAGSGVLSKTNQPTNALSPNVYTKPFEEDIKNKSKILIDLENQSKALQERSNQLNPIIQKEKEALDKAALAFTGDRESTAGAGASKAAKSSAETYIDELQKELGKQAKNINLDKVNTLLLDKLRIRSGNDNLAVKDISQIVSSIKGALDAGLVSPSLEGQATYLEKLIGLDKIAKDKAAQSAKDIKQQVTEVFSVLPSQYDAAKGNALIDTIIDDTTIQNKVALLTKIDNLLFKIRGESSALGLKKVAEGANQGLNKIAEELPDSVAKKEEKARARQVKQMETLRSLTEGVSDAFFRAADASESFGTALTKNLQQVAKQIVETYIKTLILNSVLGAFSKTPKTENGATFPIPSSSGSLLTFTKATGGEVHGLGSGTSDSNIVALSSGEAVLTARSTKALKKTLGGDIIKKLNRLGGGDFGAVSILSSMTNLGANLDGLGRYASGGEVASSSFPSTSQTAGVKIINNTSTPIQQDNVITKRTLEGLVTEIIISDQRSNGSINKSMKSSYGLSQRGVF